MNINSTVSQVAASNPFVGMAVAQAGTNSAILAALQTGDAAVGALLGAVNGQAAEANQLLASVTPNLGQHLDIQA